MARPKENKVLKEIDAIDLYINHRYTISEISTLSGKHPQTIKRYFEDHDVGIIGKGKNGSKKHLCVCNICEQSFYGKKNKKYCSTKCTNIFQNQRLKSKPLYLYNSLKQGAKKRNIYVDFTPKTFEKWYINQLKVQDNKCSITGVILRSPSEGKHLRKVSVDRVDSSKGYYPENCRLICLGLQYLKNDFSLEETLSFIQEVKTEKRAVKIDGVPASNKGYPAVFKGKKYIALHEDVLV
jgi:hypothetical protein